jgi:hypothetical protein
LVLALRFSYFFRALTGSHCVRYRKSMVVRSRVSDLALFGGGPGEIAAVALLNAEEQSVKFRVIAGGDHAVLRLLR